MLKGYSCAKRHHGSFLSYECIHFNAFPWASWKCQLYSVRKPADNKSWSLFGSLSSSTLLPETFPVTYPLNICHLSFKRDVRTTIMVFFLPKSSVLNLSQSSPRVSMWVICVCYPHANYDSVSHYSQKGCLQVASTKIQFCGEHHQRRFTAALISSIACLIAIIMYACIYKISGLLPGHIWVSL